MQLCGPPACPGYCGHVITAGNPQLSWCVGHGKSPPTVPHVLDTLHTGSPWCDIWSMWAERVASWRHVGSTYNHRKLAAKRIWRRQIWLTNGTLEFYTEFFFVLHKVFIIKRSASCKPSQEHTKWRTVGSKWRVEIKMTDQSQMPINLWTCFPNRALKPIDWISLTISVCKVW